MMAYEFTFTPRFQKHFKSLTAQEKKQLKMVDVGHHDILKQF